MNKNTQEFIINNACNYYCKQYTNALRTNACARVTVGGPFSSKIHCIHSRNLEDMLSIIYLVNRILFITTSIFTFWQYFPRFPCKKIPIFGSGGIEKSHSCKWAKWIQWHALPHIQQSTQQWNKGHYPNLHGWDFSIPPSPDFRCKRERKWLLQKN